MNTSKQRLSYLFKCYYTKSVTPAERDELFALIDSGISDEVIAELMRQCWAELQLDGPIVTPEKSKAILSSILTPPTAQSPLSKKSNNSALWLSAAAVATVFFVAVIGAYKLFSKKAVQQVAHTKIAPLPKHDALPGGNKAILTLNNGKTIILDNATTGTLAKQGATVVNKTGDGRLVYHAMAGDHKNDPVVMNTIATPRGGQYQVALPDGTQVWLNAASSLKFPTRFTGNTRDVEITGEAYFEVTKNPLIPFRVKTSRADIEVLGTHFNVMAYSDEKMMKTTLLEGAVSVKTGNGINRLQPGQQAQINAEGATKVINNVNIDEETAWKNGIFQFEDAGVDRILRQASRWYDVDVVYQGKVPDRQFTGRISRNVKASELLNMLKYTGVALKIEGKSIIVF